MSTDTEAERVVRGLTAAQRAMLLRAEAEGQLGNHFIRWWRGSGRTLRALRKRGLGFTVWSGLALTPLGLAVRDLLTQPPPAGGAANQEPPDAR